MENRFDVLIDHYLETKIGVDYSFLSEKLANGLQQNLFRLLERDQMSLAGIGNEKVNAPGQQMRSDKIYWMDESHQNIYEQEFLQLVKNFIERLNETCYAGINDYEFHYALYEEGSFYKRHKDQFRNDADRKYSLISYLNKEWTEEDGGQLWVYHGNEINKILPHAQTAVFFKSDEMEHEVTKANRSRMSITGWLKRS